MTVLSVPPVVDGGSRAVDADAIAEFVDDDTAVAGTDALATARSGGLEIDVRFGTVDAIQEAATKGVDVLLVVGETALSNHTDRLRATGISYEVTDATGV